MNAKNACFLLLIFLLVVGCSGTVSPVDPFPVANEITCESSSHEMLGLYTFVCNPEQDTVDIIQLRNAELHLNALPLLEPPPLLWLTVESPPVFNGNILDIDIGLRHPLPGMPRYTGFDVCGIVITHGSLDGFSDPKLVLAGKGDTRLLNADGYTRWWNPGEFPHGTTIFNYKDGLLGTPSTFADLNCTVNGYKYFADGLNKNAPISSLDTLQRGMFSAGQKNVRHYKINLEGGWTFNYAVDASWKKPEGGPPYAVPDDFPPGANRPEPYAIVITPIKNSLYYEPAGFKGGGELQLLIDVYDHFNAGANKINVESHAGLHPVYGLTPFDGGEGFSTYWIDLSGDSLNTTGETELLITVISDAYGYGDVLPGKSICTYSIHNFNIREPKGWARVWGGPGGEPYHYDVDRALDVAVDHDGSIYVTGTFSDTVDFDPGPGHSWETGATSHAAFLSKFTNNGIFQWVRVWGEDEGQGTVEPTGIAIDNSGNIYTTGFFKYQPVDFDTGPGVDIHTPPGQVAAFISKIDSEGNFLWARSWGSMRTEANDIAVDGYGNILVTGWFDSWADFDPGPGVDEHFSYGGLDAFVSAFTSNGAFIGTKTWGGWYTDQGTAIAVDESNNVYVTGKYQDTVDFNPGPGFDFHTSNSGEDFFLSKFNSQGGFVWARTWGGTSNTGIDSPCSVVVNTSGDVYVTGSFYGYCDFDPGPGVDDYGGIFSGFKGFLSKFDQVGNYQWKRIFGQKSQAANLDSFGNIYITGYFHGNCDFCPGPISDEYTANGYYDAHLTKFDLDGNYQWTRVWGGEGTEYTSGVAADTSGNVFVSGYFYGTADFDPSSWDYIISSTKDAYGDSTHDAYLWKCPPDGNW